MEQRQKEWLVFGSLLVLGIVVQLIGVSFLGFFILLAAVFSVPPLTDRMPGSPTAWSVSIISLLIGISTGTFGYRGGILLLLLGVAVNPFIYGWVMDRFDRELPRWTRTIIVGIVLIGGIGQLHVATAGTYDPIASSEQFHSTNQTLSILPGPDSLYGNWTVNSLETDGSTATRMLHHSSQQANLTLRVTATAYPNAAEARATYRSLAPDPSVNENITVLDGVESYGNESVAFDRDGSLGLSFYHSNMYVVLALSSAGSVPPDERLLDHAATAITTQLQQ